MIVCSYKTFIQSLTKSNILKYLIQIWFIIKEKRIKACTIFFSHINL